MKKIEIKIAELHQHQIETYQRLHDEIPFANRLGMLEAGYTKLDIYRFGTLLVMRIEIDTSVIVSASHKARMATGEWKRLTDPLFAQPWAEAEHIYGFDAASFLGTLQNV